MSCTSILPPEILDLIADNLHDEPATLKTCCVVSKSWVPRARKHLFAHVEFNASPPDIELWKKTFPDPSNSPAHHARTLSIRGIPSITAADAGVGGWIRAFHNVEHLRLVRPFKPPLVPFYGLSPVVRSLRLTQFTIGVFDLICSFPLLEDLALILLYPESEADGWNPPLTSPKLTGCLELRSASMFRSIARRLSVLPGGLRFSNIKAVFFNKDAEPVTDLVSRCSDTLEILTMIYLRREPSTTPPIDLSKATRLKRLEFRGEDLSVQWITTTLQTVKSKSLQHITIYPAFSIPETIEEAVHQEWQDLERMLVQFWTSHSIRLQVTARNEGKNPGDHVPSLLPELTKRGLVGPVEALP